MFAKPPAVNTKIAKDIIIATLGNIFEGHIVQKICGVKMSINLITFCKSEAGQKQPTVTKTHTGHFSIGNE